MAEEKKSGFFDQLKDATNVVVEKTRDGVEDLQQKRELSETYGELGRKTAELVEGRRDHPPRPDAVRREDRRARGRARRPAAGGRAARPSETPAG